MVKTIEGYHVPVLLQPSIDGLDIRPGGVYVDATFGGGGHSRELLSRLDSTAHLYSFDQDADAEKNVFQLETGGQQRFIDDPRFTFVRSNFRYLRNWMRYYGVEGIDGLLADLGVSSHHFDDESRGFSFRFDAPLDMRMNKREGKTAADIVNTYAEDALAKVFYLYGEDFLHVVEPFFKREREKKDLACLFQALRIEVNHEMEALSDMLLAAIDCLKPGGRLCIITYHSLEDRMVKNIMKTGNIAGERQVDFYGRMETPLKLVNNKVIVPDSDEQRENSRSRSAKLRIAEKK